MPLHFRFRCALFSLLLAPLLLVACAGADEEDAPPAPPEEIYNQALAELQDENTKKAAKLFDEVERQHPYSPWATRAQLMSAYAHYQGLDYDSAVAALDRFISLHPGHEHVSYAFYLRALCSYERIPDVRRDQSFTESARDALQDVMRRFPDTAYARDARLKLSLVQDHLAGREMEIGRFYLNRRVPTAAIGRFRTVVTEYQTTSHVPEALLRMIEAYLMLGLREEAVRTGAVLGYNFPGEKWYERAYARLAALGATLPDTSANPQLPPAPIAAPRIAVEGAPVESAPVEGAALEAVSEPAPASSAEDFTPERGTALPPPDPTR